MKTTPEAAVDIVASISNGGASGKSGERVCSTADEHAYVHASVSAETETERENRERERKQ